MKEYYNIALVVPALNSSKTISQVLHYIPDMIKFIIVVDDGSYDNTSEIVKSINDKRIYLINHADNMGVGAATLTGYQKGLELGSHVIVKMDSDGQMDPGYLESLVQPIINGKADYTKGNRFLHLPHLNRMPLLRRVGNLGLSFLTKLASGYWNIFDPTNGYTAISADIIRSLVTRRISKRFFFETSMLIELGMLGAVVKDISIPAVYHNQESHLSEWRAFFEFPPKLVKGFIRRIIYRYYLLDFTAVSLLLSSGIFFLLFGLIFGLSAWVNSARAGVIASTGTVMIAVLPVIIGVQLILQSMVLDIQNVPKDVLTNMIRKI